MASHLKFTLIIFAVLVVILQIAEGQNEPHAESEEKDDSSSEQTLEDSNESRKRCRRSVQTSIEETDDSAGQGKAAALPRLPAIPGLPDPETIIKIAEILTTVGQQVLPILVSGNLEDSDFVANRISHDMKFLNKFKNELDVLSAKLKKFT